MSLAVARAEHSKAVAMVRIGEDPAVAAKTAKAQRSTIPTVDAFFEEWLIWKQASKPARESTIEAYRHAFLLYISKDIGIHIIEIVQVDDIHIVFFAVIWHELIHGKKAVLVFRFRHVGVPQFLFGRRVFLDPVVEPLCGYKISRIQYIVCLRKIDKGLF
jgi:hypothetical protein